MCSNGWLEFNEFIQFNVSSRLPFLHNLQRTENGNSVVCSCSNGSIAGHAIAAMNCYCTIITLLYDALCNDCLPRGLSMNFIILFILGILVCTQNYRKWLRTHPLSLSLSCLHKVHWILYYFMSSPFVLRLFFWTETKEFACARKLWKKVFWAKVFARRIFENEIDRKTNGKKNTHHRVHAQWNEIGIPLCICACIPSLEYKLFYKTHDHELKIAECSANFVHLLLTFFLSGRHPASSENFILFNDCRSSVPTQKKWNHRRHSSKMDFI